MACAKGEPVRSKICESFSAAVSDIADGASIMMYILVGPGGVPQNLISALRDQGTGNLTLITSNFGQTGTTHSSRDFKPYVSARILVENRQVKKAIVSFLAGFAAYRDQGIEIELCAMGTLYERIRAGGAGIGGYFSPIGVDAVVSEGKERRVIDGTEYLLETPLRADYAFIRARTADEMGNLVYQGSSRGGNPIIATAADFCIAEVDEIVPVGELDPEHIITPGIYIDRIIKVGA